MKNVKMITERLQSSCSSAFICVHLRFHSFLSRESLMRQPWRSFGFPVLAALLVLLATGPAVRAADSKDGGSVLSMIRESGPSGIAFMVVLGLFSLVAVAVIIERLVNLTRGKVIPPAFVTGVQELVQRKEADPAPFRELCRSFPSPVASVLRSGLTRAGRPVPEVEKAMEDAVAREAATLRSRVRPLGVIASVAPLVGLLGTVVGMIIAFRTASQQGLGGKAELLAEGIYLALLTTAAGLTIAIPSLMLAAYFNSQIDRFLREGDEQLMEVIPCFARMEQAAPARSAATDRMVLEETAAS
jgi:biopolymer transport protein ExbB